ncbi:hypothetical protein B0I35DRAFT_413180 [Stachybotrys elegans]|uniref:Uncharacterized protein n=1 Tax=Stachybotrys elegans TaxID=80388 RepID=A0A8K0SL43_9HYPO|nr:hypothetical protein B0I35DRAFT_413180 [Stachybotrys elegans]
MRSSIIAAALALAGAASAQTDNLGLGGGFINITTSKVTARIARNAQVLVSLSPADSAFDFLPADKLTNRARNQQYHWGDITYRYRVGDGGWVSADSSLNRRPVEALASDSDEVFASANIGATLPDGPLSITREWIDVEGDLGLRFVVENTADEPVEIGSLGFPAEFNSIFTQRTPLDMQRLCSLSDPYIGMDAGHIRVAPVSGSGAALVVTALNGTKTPLEAYRNLNEYWVAETGYGSQTFEGLYEWQVYSKAYAENQWAAQEPWNPASSRTLAPGESVQLGVRFTVSPEGVRGLDAAVLSTGNPVAVGIPGYIVPRDLPAQLFLQHSAGVETIDVSPEGALAVEASGESYTVTPSPSAWGRARLTVTYADGKVQTIHYYITKSTPDVMADLGNFLTTKAWFNKTDEPFNRNPSVMTYDYEVGAIREQDSRVWITGLSDEGGTGAYVAAMMKQVVLPNAEEIAKLEDFVDMVVWGGIQNPDFSVRKSVFFYEPAAAPDYPYNGSFNWGSWTSWNRQSAAYIDRAYNYIHVTVAYWSLYRVSRAYDGVVTHHPWGWYLDQAYETAMRCQRNDVWYRDVGLMGETVWGELLLDLQREGREEQAANLEAAMEGRARLWHSQEIPYGSEMAWDSTGQEGVYYWTRHFGLTESEDKTINSVLGFTPTVPHWGWNGNSRRYWDFVYGGKLQRIERQIHHYGSGLNSQVLLSAFRDDPSDLYLLRVGYGGTSGPLSNINQEGFPSAAFHSWPDTLKWDGITGDYGGGFVGMALGAGTYVAQSSQLGLVAFGGILSTSEGVVTVQPRDPVRRRVFIGPLGLLITLDAALVESFSYEGEDSVTLSIGQQEGAPVASRVVVWLESATGEGWSVVSEAVEARGGWEVSLGQGTATVSITRG